MRAGHICKINHKYWLGTVLGGFLTVGVREIGSFGSELPPGLGHCSETHLEPQWEL